MNKMAMGQVSLDFVRLQRQLSFHQLFTGDYCTRTVCPVKATVPRENGGTPSRE